MMQDVRFGGGIAASGQGARFGGNLFTRDACRMMRDVMPNPYYRSMVREMLGILPQWQGVKEDPLTNEFPDAFQHQVFRECIAGRWLPPELIDAENGVAYWTGKWGVPLQEDPVNGRSFVIYNSSDGPLLYLITLAEFCRLPGGRTVLDDRFQHWPSGTTRTVTEAAHRCLGFIVKMIQDSEERGLGLYAVPNTNPNQTSPSGVMRDGWDAYIHVRGEHGEPADYSYMAYVENQALCYEALLVGAELFPNDEKVKLWLQTAEQIRSRTEQMLWLDRFYAAAIDGYGPIELESNAVLEMLNGPYFEGLPDAPERIVALTDWLYSPQVMTPVGPRMISLKFAGLERYDGDYYAYQSTGAVWPHVNGIIAKGLRRWDLKPVAFDLGTNRLIGGYNRSHAALELWYVHRESNQPVYDPMADKRSPDESALTIRAAEMGSLDQGWGITAAIHELEANSEQVAEPSANSWQFAQSHRLLEKAEAVPPASDGVPVDVIYVDLKEGKRLKEERALRLRLVA